MRGRNRKTRRVKDKGARDAFRRRISKLPKPVPDEAAAKFYATEAAEAGAPVEDK